MAVTISVYNHTAKRFAQGSNDPSHTYKVMLCTAATFNAGDGSLDSVVKTQVAATNGYTAGGVALTNVALTTLNVSGAKFDADDASWTATTGPIAAAYGILYNATDAPLGTTNPVVAFIDFGGTETAGAGTDFLIVWDTNGIFTWTLAT